VIKCMSVGGQVVGGGGSNGGLGLREGGRGWLLLSCRECVTEFWSQSTSRVPSAIKVAIVCALISLRVEMNNGSLV